MDNHKEINEKTNLIGDKDKWDPICELVFKLI